MPRDSFRTLTVVSSTPVPALWVNEWNATGMTMATTAMPVSAISPRVSGRRWSSSEEGWRTEEVDVELRGPETVALLVEADAAREEAAAEDEEAVREDAAEHRRADDAELSLDEREDCCKNAHRSDARGGEREQSIASAPMMSSTALLRGAERNRERNGNRRSDNTGRYSPKSRVQETAERISDADGELFGGKAEDGGQRDDGCTREESVRFGSEGGKEDRGS